MAQEKESPTGTGRESTRSESGDETRTISRRSCLRYGATAALFGGAAALTGGSANAAEAVDIVEAGADPNGNEVIDGVLEGLSGQTVNFPEGTYMIDGASLGGGTELVGNNATLVPARSGRPIILDFSGSGWSVHGNFTVDQTASSTCARVSLSGSGSFGGSDGRIVWDGIADILGGTGSAGHTYMFSTNVSDKITIKNCTLADGAMRGGSNVGLLWTDTGGTLEFDGCHFRGWANNCLYTKAMRGRLVVRNTYFEDNTVEGIRVGADQGTLVENCAFAYGNEISLQAFSGGNAQRGIWLNPDDGPVDLTVRNCDFIEHGPVAAGAIVQHTGPTNVTVENSRFSMNGRAVVAMDDGTLQATGIDVPGDHGGISAPSGSVTDSCVNGGASTISVSTSNITDGGCEQATDPDGPLNGSDDGSSGDGSTGGGGSGDGSPGSDLSNTLLIDGSVAPDSVANYEFTVSGDLAKSTASGATKDADDDVSGSTATGSVANYLDAYEFAGEVTDIAVDGEAALHLNGEAVTVSSLRDDGSSGDGGSGTSYPHTIVFRSGEDDVSYYEFAVDGSLRKNASLDEPSFEDNVTEDSVRGFVTDDVDAYDYSGSIQDLTLTGDATVSFRAN